MFTSLFNTMQDNQVLNLNLLRTGDKLVVCFQPLASNDTGTSGSNLSPLVITATPAELDAGFLAAISTPLQERFGMITNLEAFKESTRKAAPKPAAKSEVTVSAGTKANEKKSKSEQLIEEAEKLFKQKNLPGAYGIYKKLYEQDKTNAKIGNRMHEIWALMSQKPLFGDVQEGQVTVETVEDKVPVITPTVIAEPVKAVGTEVKQEAPQEDMFAAIINQGRIPVEEAAIENKQEEIQPEQPVILPPGMTQEQYNQFLAFQQYQKQMAGTGVTV